MAGQTDTKKRTASGRRPTTAAPAVETTAPAAENAAPEKPIGVSLDAALLELAKSEISGLKIVQKKAYHRLLVNGKTVAYVAVAKKGLRVDVPSGKGKYDRLTPATEQETTAAVAKIKKVAEKAVAA